MKKILGIIAALCISVSGCASNQGTVSTDGSTSMEKVIGYLSEAYTEKNPNVKVTYNPTGSGAGIQAVLDGRCDIGLSSRALTAEEKETLTETVIAVDAIAVIVNPANPISNLSLEDISKVYRGEITNWSEIGGSDSPIVLIGREAASGTRDGFESITGTKDLCKYTQELTATGDVVQTVASNPNAVGYASLASVKDNVKTLSVNGVTPNTNTVQNGEYQIRRDFIFVTKSDKELSASAGDFFSFASSNADDIIERAGAIPVAR